MRNVLALAVLAILLASCGQSRVVRREPASAQTYRRAPAVVSDSLYVVRKGDTLYGIAFRHGLDFRDVASWNRIAAPYTIYPGQRLRLRSAVGSTPTARTSPSRSTTASPPRTTAPPAPRSSRAVTTMPAPSSAVSRPTESTTQPPAVPPTSLPVHSGRWLWPTQGQIIGRYVAGDPTKQGIDIAGSAGQPVLAAGDGVVVYSGTGLVGYGEVIIVKHSDEWLSAYGHNRKRLVAEGAPVKAGQTIAELGRSGTSRDMLHFEIRRNGKPVDPMSLLPPH